MYRMSVTILFIWFWFRYIFTFCPVSSDFIPFNIFYSLMFSESLTPLFQHPYSASFLWRWVSKYCEDFLNNCDNILQVWWNLQIYHSSNMAVTYDRESIWRYWVPIIIADHIRLLKVATFLVLSKTRPSEIMSIQSTHQDVTNGCYGGSMLILCKAVYPASYERPMKSSHIVLIYKTILHLTYWSIYMYIASGNN